MMIQCLSTAPAITCDEEGEEKALKMLRNGRSVGPHSSSVAELSADSSSAWAIARALINDSVLIIADEPTGNLDSHSGMNPQPSCAACTSGGVHDRDWSSP